MEQMLKPDEVSKTLRVSSRTVRRMCERGELKGKKVGRQWRIKSADLQIYLDETATDDEEDAEQPAPVRRAA